MRKVILNLALTLDGFIEGPNGEIDWIVKDKEIDFGDILLDILSDKDVIFYGRKSYEKWGHFVPDPGASQKLKDAYVLLNSKQKCVFSTTRTGDNTNAIFINDNIQETVNTIKQQPGKNIWLYGGAEIVTTFLNLDLIDEYRLAIHPVIIGKGKPLFRDIEQWHGLKLVQATSYPSGVLLVRYQAQR